jgi:hypothetical protein
MVKGVQTKDTGFFKELSNHLNVYKFEGNLLSDPEVAFSFVPMNVSQLKKILQHGDDEKKIEAELDEILASNVMVDNKPCDPLELYIEDRFWILFNMRLKSRGETLDTTYKCPGCSQVIPLPIDLTELEIVEGKGSQLNTNVSLNQHVSLTLDNIRRKDILILDEWHEAREEQKENVPEEPEETEDDTTNEVEESQETDDNPVDNILSLYGLMIKKIKISPSVSPSEQPKAPIERSDLSLDEKVMFLNMLNEIDYEKMKEWAEENYFGVKVNIKIKCPVCKETSEEVLNIGNFF